MPLADGDERRIGEHAGLAFAERRPRLLHHTVFCHVGVRVNLLVERIGLDLVDHRRDLVERDEVRETVREEVAHADGAHHAVLVELLERVP